MKTTRAYVAVILIFVIAVSAYLFWNHRRVEKQEERAYAEEGKRLKSQVAIMASRWNAVTNWQASFRERLPSAIYTSDIEQAVLGERPILVYAQLDDIKTDGNTYTVQLSSPVTQWFLHMHYSLLCDAELGRKLIGEKHSEFEIFALVAYIDRVEKRSETDTYYFLAQGTAKEAILVGIRGLALANLETTARGPQINAAGDSQNE
jgi:hypothetical protein